MEMVGLLMGVIGKVRYLMTHRRPTKRKMAKAFNTEISPLLNPIGDRETLAEFIERQKMGVALHQFWLFAVGADRELNLETAKSFIQFNHFDLE